MEVAGDDASAEYPALGSGRPSSNGAVDLPTVGVGDGAVDVADDATTGDASTCWTTFDVDF